MLSLPRTCWTLGGILVARSYRKVLTLEICCMLRAGKSMYGSSFLTPSELKFGNIGI